MDLQYIKLRKDDIDKIVAFINEKETSDLMWFLQRYTEEGKSYPLEKEVEENTSGVQILFYEIVNNNPFSQMMSEVKPKK